MTYSTTTPIKCPCGLDPQITTRPHLANPYRVACPHATTRPGRHIEGEICRESEPQQCDTLERAVGRWNRQFDVRSLTCRGDHIPRCRCGLRMPCNNRLSGEAFQRIAEPAPAVARIR